MKSKQTKVEKWLLDGLNSGAKAGKPHHRADHQPWWKVMCLSGVDYFSTLGYQPGIAFMAAGLLSPVATLILVAVTLLAALPVYRHVAHESPHGQGSISMLEHLLPGWLGKVLVLCLLGFAATDFLITITLSASDAAAHVVENPFMQVWFDSRMLVTLGLLALLGAIFLAGFREVIGMSVVLVGAYLGLNAVVLGAGLFHLASQPALIAGWAGSLIQTHGSPWSMVAVSLLVFPKLALGLSGFETGVAVMPLVKGEKHDNQHQPVGRIANTKKLLLTDALIMSVFLVVSSVVTTLLIPASAFQAGGAADGRAISYLAHLYLGDIFGTVYDFSTIAILWFAGASAMAGLINLVPRYLPRYGMAPEWAKAVRPLVLFFTAIAFIVTLVFHADVNAQGGAYATGVLVLMTSAAVASTLSVWEESKMRRFAFAAISLVFSYITVANIVERPDGMKVAAFFIIAVIITSLVSRSMRSMELRVKAVDLDGPARLFVAEAASGTVRIIAHRPHGTDYCRKLKEMCEVHNIPDEELLFLEVERGDPSEFTDDVLEVYGVRRGRHKVLRCQSPAIPNAIAALLLHIRDVTGRQPHVYLGWSEGNPIAYVLKYLLWGEGETAFVVREVLREAEHRPFRRPRVHVG